VLRRVRRLPPPASPPPHVVGRDDGAGRKGHRDGTIVIDGERGGPIDVLEDRCTETGAAGLRAHPEGQIVARDRAAADASGLRQGAPEATQVADRLPLLHNLAATLEAVFSAHHRDRTARHAATRPAPVRLDAAPVAVPVAPPVASPNAQQQRAQTRAPAGHLCAGLGVTPSGGGAAGACGPHGLCAPDGPAVAPRGDVSGTPMPPTPPVVARPVYDLPRGALEGGMPQWGTAVS
jgi:hypothetical protein